MNILIPKRKRGRQSEAAVIAYEQALWAFASEVKQIASTLDFRVSSRGWCYVLEEHGLTKGDFDIAQRLINDCRKRGLLPLDICAEDGARKTDGIEDPTDDEDPEGYADWAVKAAMSEAFRYRPFSFWDDQDYYVEVLVEKIDLKSLFEPVCRRYFVPITNARGWTDLNSRAAMMRRFSQHEKDGRQPVLLYCGDHDPGGLIISDSIRSNMAELAGAVGWEPSDLEIIRFGLNYEFIEDQRLTWIDNLETASGGRLDSTKHPDHKKAYVQDYLRRFGARKVEANALVVRSEAGRKLCEESINSYIDPESVKAYEERIDEAQDEVRQAMPDAFRQYVAELNEGGD